MFLMGSGGHSCTIWRYINVKILVPIKQKQNNLGEWFPQSAVLEERSRIAAVIRSHSPATAIFPDLTLPVVEEPVRETPLKECETKKAAPAATRSGKSNADN